MLGVVPAQQGLDGFDVTGGDVDLRLVVEFELLLVDRLPQLVLERQPPGHGAAHVEIEVQRTASPVSFACFSAASACCTRVLPSTPSIG